MISSAKRPRIALVVPGLGIGGGVPAVASFIYRAIRRDGRFDPFFISLSMSSRDRASVLISVPSTWMRGIATRTGIFNNEPFVEVGAFLGEIELMRYQPRAALTAAVTNCDIIQVVGGTPAWANAVIGLHKPVALHAATLIKIERRKRLAGNVSLLGLWRRIMTRLTASLDDATLRQVDVAFVENPHMAAYAEACSSRGKPLVRYAPPGIDTNLFRPAIPGEISPIDEPYILCTGRLSDPRKNIELLLEAHSRLPERDRPLLVLAGKTLPDAIVARYRERQARKDRIRLIHKPTAAELARLYRHAQCFALPSDEEGFGVVVIEAMASGVPVVSTRSGGPDGIVSEGKDGFLVDRDDVQGMTERLTMLMGDRELAATIGRQARLTAEATYSEEIAGRVFLDTYDMLLSRGQVEAA